MSLDCQVKLIRGHPATIIGHADKGLAAFSQLDIDAVSVGIKRVLNQFFDDRCRPLDDLARGNLIDQRVR